MKTNVEQASMRPHIWARCVLWEAAADHLTYSSKTGFLPNANDSKCNAHGTEAQTTKHPPPRAATEKVAQIHRFDPIHGCTTMPIGCSARV